MADAPSLMCPSCQAPNRDAAKFCDACGTSMIARCQGCERELRPEARFCDECGRPAFVLAPSREVPAPPSQVTEQILDTRDALMGERKQVTVLFADVKGAMDLQADLDPEEWARIMGRFVVVLDRMALLSNVRTASRTIGWISRLRSSGGGGSAK